jgi:methionyl-tRNA formyltransferase
MTKPSVILLGSKPGAVVAFNLLQQLGWNIRCVVVSDSSKYSWIPCDSLEQVATKNNIQVLKSQDEVDTSQKVDFIISYMYRSLVKSSVCNMALKAALNFHAGPLPQFGGWAFYNIAILENETEYGCTCHYMDNNFDTGPILRVNKFKIDSSLETAVTLERKTQVEMVKLFHFFCDLVESGEDLPLEHQQKHEMRYMTYEEFSKLKEIPANADEETKQRYARAFWYPPYECAYILSNGVKLEIVPNIVKENLAYQYHKHDFKYLTDALVGLVP